MKILLAGTLNPTSTTLHRSLAMERLGHTIVSLTPHAPGPGRGRVYSKLAFELTMGPHIGSFNRELLALAERERPDIFWDEKSLIVLPETLRKLDAMGIVTVSYMIDNAFGPRRDSGFRLYKKCLPFFDLHVTQRDVSVQHYRERGARDVIKIQTAYEPSLHFPSPVPLTDADRDRGVSFIGMPYDDRARIVTQLSDSGVPLILSGDPVAWKRKLDAAHFNRLFRVGPLFGDDYRKAIWHSKINLSFLTKSNQDEYTHKSFEIAACGGFLLCERSEGHSLKFKEDEEAVFFGSTEELIAKIGRYLPDEAARNRIGAAGAVRAQRDGYHNDRQISLVLARVLQIRIAKEAGAGKVAA